MSILPLPFDRRDPDGSLPARHSVARGHCSRRSRMSSLVPAVHPQGPRADSEHRAQVTFGCSWCAYVDSFALPTHIRSINLPCMVYSNIMGRSGFAFFARVFSFAIATERVLPRRNTRVVCSIPFLSSPRSSQRKTSRCFDSPEQRV